MTTTKTRAQIAESLREDAEKEHLDELSDGELLDVLEIALGLGAYKDGYEAELFRALADLIAPQLPDGIEWPRFEDGELVGIGDEVWLDSKTWNVYAIRFDRDSWTMQLSAGCDYGALSGGCNERVKRPKPRVLDADGVPIEVGDTVYLDGKDSPLEVLAIYTSGYRFAKVMNRAGEYLAVDPPRLTHKRPDSWEQLEEEAKLPYNDYWRSRGESGFCEKGLVAQKEDLVARAKALAKAGE